LATILVAARFIFLTDIPPFPLFLGGGSLLITKLLARLPIVFPFKQASH